MTAGLIVRNIQLHLFQAMGEAFYRWECLGMIWNREFFNWNGSSSAKLKTTLKDKAFSVTFCDSYKCLVNKTILLYLLPVMDDVLQGTYLSLPYR